MMKINLDEPGTVAVQIFGDGARPPKSGYAIRVIGGGEGDVPLKNRVKPFGYYMLFGSWLVLRRDGRDLIVASSNLASLRKATRALLLDEWTAPEPVKFEVAA